MAAPTPAEAVKTANPDQARVANSSKVWTTLITNTKYLSGLLTLDSTLKESGSKYPLVALYTDEFPSEGHAALDTRNIPKKRIRYLKPSKEKDYTNDPRFYDCWSKLAPYSLIEYDRVVQLDSDMFVLKNMDELMDIELDPREMEGNGNRVFAASHACVCNPLKKPHYPKDWVPENCGFTAQHGIPEEAQKNGASPLTSLGMPNGGLQVINPSAVIYAQILEQLTEETSVDKYDFADQSMLGDIFRGRWVTLPYIYNALKTLRWKGVHDAIWRDEEVKNVHMLLSPKAWDEKEGQESDETHKWWNKANKRRLEVERARGVDDGF